MVGDVVEVWAYLSLSPGEVRDLAGACLREVEIPAFAGMTDWEKKWGKDDAHALVRAGRGIAGLRLHAPGSSARGDGAHRMARRRADSVDGALEIGRASCREREWQYV